MHADSRVFQSEWNKLFIAVKEEAAYSMSMNARVRQTHSICQRMIESYSSILGRGWSVTTPRDWYRGSWGLYEILYTVV